VYAASRLQTAGILVTTKSEVLVPNDPGIVICTAFGKERNIRWPISVGQRALHQ
jgi:hypothetical protein